MKVGTAQLAIAVALATPADTAGMAPYGSSQVVRTTARTPAG